MRQKKHKKVQRTITFLKVTHQFREPFKVRPPVPQWQAACTAELPVPAHYAIVVANDTYSALLTRVCWCMQVVLDGNFINALLQSK